jgi:hypothetical protein
MNINEPNLVWLDVLCPAFLVRKSLQNSQPSVSEDFLLPELVPNIAKGIRWNWAPEVVLSEDNAELELKHSLVWSSSTSRLQGYGLKQAK